MILSHIAAFCQRRKVCHGQLLKYIMIHDTNMGPKELPSKMLEMFRDEAKSWQGMYLDLMVVALGTKN